MKKPISKKRRKKLFSRKPHNYVFWRGIVASDKDLDQFYERGSDRQLSLIIRTLNYLKRYEGEYFEEINGDKKLKKFKGEENE